MTVITAVKLSVAGLRRQAAGAVALNGSPLLIFKGKNPATKPDFFDQKVRSQASKNLAPGVKYKYAQT